MWTSLGAASTKSWKVAMKKKTHERLQEKHFRTLNDLSSRKSELNCGLTNYSTGYYEDRISSNNSNRA